MKNSQKFKYLLITTSLITLATSEIYAASKFVVMGKSMNLISSNKNGWSKNAMPAKDDHIVFSKELQTLNLELQTLNLDENQSYSSINIYGFDNNKLAVKKMLAWELY